MKVLVTGAEGQVGRALRTTAPGGVEVLAANHAMLDLADTGAIDAFVASHGADVVINAAAYTTVDRAEAEPALAAAVNATGAGALAAACARRGIRFVHLSTDFVFDGTASRPYRPEDPTAPLSVYGRTKRDGEDLARRHHPHCLVVRTAWVYASEGNNFVATMLRLMRAGKSLRVVGDQIGTPTYAPGLAAAMWRLVALKPEGILHYTDSGVASWYDFAVAIQEEALALGLLSAPVAIEPIATADYPTPARRPGFSVLDKAETNRLLGGAPAHWRVALRGMLKESSAHA